jgi:hypothetical protein
MFRKTGNKLPNSRRVGQTPYPVAIADALRSELGQSHRAIKTVMLWTGASDRTAKNWLSGAYGPSGDHLIGLARESDAVLATLLSLAGRSQYMIAIDLIAIQNALSAATSLIDNLLDAAPDGRK